MMEILLKQFTVNLDYDHGIDYSYFFESNECLFNSSNQSQTQCFQSVILSVPLILHPAQQNNPMLKKMTANKIMDTTLEMMMAAGYTLLVLEKITLTLVEECDYYTIA